MDQRDEKIQQLSAENRRLVWKTERLDAEIVLLKRQVAALTERLADEGAHPLRTVYPSLEVTCSPAHAWGMLHIGSDPRSVSLEPVSGVVGSAVTNACDDADCDCGGSDD